MSRNIFLVDRKMSMAARWSAEFLELFDSKSSHSNIETCLTEIEGQKDDISAALIICHIHDSDGMNARLRELRHVRGCPKLYMAFFSGGGMTADQEWIEYCQEAMEEGMLEWAGVLLPPVDGNQRAIDQTYSVCTTFMERDSSEKLKKELGSILRISEDSEEYVIAFSILIQGFLAVADVCGKAKNGNVESVVSKMGGSGRPWRGVEDIKSKWSIVSNPEWWQTTLRNPVLSRKKLENSFQENGTKKKFDEFMAWTFEGSNINENELVTMMAALLETLLDRK